ncbi:hypothetical protein LCGC14_1530440 [marine sediment metagenome]|uniref:Uncharacterized protein n=1 Tax=marine sediment metagenome TaxID=412755 RepID=A0A0F9LBR8_9ZZZZ
MTKQYTPQGWITLTLYALCWLFAFVMLCGTAEAQGIVLEIQPIAIAKHLDMIFLKASESVLAATPVGRGKVKIEWRSFDVPNQTGVIYLGAVPGSRWTGGKVPGAQLWSGDLPLNMVRRIILIIPAGLFVGNEGHKSQGYLWLLNYDGYSIRRIDDVGKIFQRGSM